MPKEQERFLVTGAAGFIGSNIVRALLDEGAAVRGIDNFATGRRENIAEILDRMEWIEGDLAVPGVAEEAMEGIDYVLHQAAIPSVPRSVADPLATNTSCIDATLRVLLAAREKKVRRVVLAASSSAYGDTPTLPKREDMPTSPLSPYAVAKLAQEQYARAFSICYGTETVSLRYFNVFGPRQDPKSDYAAVIPKFITMMVRGRTPTIHGDGLQSRDFTYIDNVVEGNLLAARAAGPFRGEVMNLAIGDRISLLDLVAELNRILGTEIAPKHGPERPGDVKHSQADVTRARERIGFRPVVPFAEGLARTAAYYREHPDS